MAKKLILKVPSVKIKKKHLKVWRIFQGIPKTLQNYEKILKLRKFKTFE